MPRGSVSYLVVPLLFIALVGCRFVEFEERDPWRTQAEERCVSEGQIRQSSFQEPRPPVNGKGTCGMARPFEIAAVNGGHVEFKPKATLACPLVSAVEQWFHEGIQPAAMAWYGSPVTEVRQISAYSCRTMNGQPGTPISEHAFGNALDIASFRFADGRTVNFKDGWRGKPEEQGFLRAVHAAACERFSTVLAPGSNAFHYDHIHVDLARRASGRNICNPAPMTRPAPPPRLEVPVAQAPSPAPTQRAQVRAAPPPASPWAQPAQASRQATGPARPADPTSPWAHSAPEVVQRPAGASSGPVVIAREPDMPRDTRPAGAPLVLGNEAPPHNSFGTPVPIAQRVRDQLGLQQQPAHGQYMQAAPTHAPRMQAPPPPPGQQNPYGLTPPARIPNARTGADSTVTGSIKSDAAKKREQAKPLQANLMSPRSMAEEAPNSEPASVFNLPATAR